MTVAANPKVGIGAKDLRSIVFAFLRPSPLVPAPTVH